MKRPLYSWKDWKPGWRQTYLTFRNIPCTARLHPIRNGIVLSVVTAAFVGGFFLGKDVSPISVGKQIYCLALLCAICWLFWFIGQAEQHRDRWKHR